MAETALATAYVKIVPSFKGFSDEWRKNMPDSTAPGEDQGRKFSTGFSKSVGGSLKRQLAGVFAAGAVVSFTKDLIAAGEAEVSSNRKLENITKSMGLFGNNAMTVAKRLEELSGVQQLQLGIDDDTIKSTQMKLLTFKNLAMTAGQAGGMFDRASMAAQDLAAAGFGSAETNAVQLGKALQDPVKGITALARSGVTFTEQEKVKIATLVESGKMLEAQNMVLGAIETQVGGTAAAGVTASDKMKQGFNQIKETLGLALLPAFNQVGDYIGKVLIPYIKDFIERFKNGQTFLNPVWEGIKAFVGFMIQYKDFLLPLVAGIIAIVAAYKTYTAIMAVWNAITVIATGIQAAFDVVLNANPISLIVIAIAALIAGLVLFFTKTTVGKAILQGFFDFVKLGFAMIKGLAIDFANYWIDGLNLIIHAINAFIHVWNMIPGHADMKTFGTIGNIEGGLTLSNNPLSTPNVAPTGTPAATGAVTPRPGGTTGNTLIYNAAPNQSLDSHQELKKSIAILSPKAFK